MLDRNSRWSACSTKVDDSAGPEDYLFMQTGHAYDVAVVGAGVFGAWTAYLIPGLGRECIGLPVWCWAQVASSEVRRGVFARLWPDEKLLAVRGKIVGRGGELGKRVVIQFHVLEYCGLARGQAILDEHLAIFEKANGIEKITAIELEQRFPRSNWAPWWGHT